MIRRIQIKEKYTQETLRFQSYSKFINLPYLNVILKNLENGEVDLVVNRFKIDTGAAISIVNRRYKTFVDNISIDDYLPIQYGSGPPKICPVYKTGMIIKGHEFDSLVVYDDTCPYLLLGFYGFLDQMTYTVFDQNLKQSIIYRL